MRERGNVDTLLAVFDWTAPKKLVLGENWSTRVMLLYDRKTQVKKYTLLSPEMPEEVINKLTLWLEQHGDIDDIACRLGASRANTDYSLDLSVVY